MKKTLLSLLLLTITSVLLGQVSPLINHSPLLFQNKQGYVPCLILVDKNCNETELNKFNVKIQTKAGNVWSVLIPKNRILEVSEISNIITFEPASRITSMRYKLDSSTNALKVNQVHNGRNFGLAENYKGKGVIVGIVDIGMDYRHPAFYASDSTTYRISRVWQQNNDDGTPPNGFDYGSELIGKEQILQDREYLGSHATHVAGIAAGSGIGSPDLKYQGMAPDAEIVYVSIKHYNNDLQGSALGDYLIANPAIIDAYKYIFDYAKTQGKPAVINLSWGMHTGPHDGTSLFDLATENLVGEGLILVGAAGNEGTNNMHFDANLRGDTTKTIIIENQRNSYKKEEVYVDVWGSGNSVFSVSIHLIDTQGQIVYETPFLSSQKDGLTTKTFNTEDGIFQAITLTTSSYIPNSKPNITLLVTNPNPKKYYVGLSITSPFCNLHAWNSGGIYRWTTGSFVNKIDKINFTSNYKKGNTEFTVGENGGTSKDVITVGSYTAKTFFVGVNNDSFDNSGYSKVGQITPFSSRGPLPDGRIKPDILAPGSDVGAPIFLEEYPGWNWNRILAFSEFNSDTFAYGPFSGTSMAAPHVTGIVALMLQANPKLTSYQIKQILQNTATIDNYTGVVPNPNAGWGKINAYECVKESYRILNANNVIAPSNKIIAFPNPTNDEITIESSFELIKSLEIYSVTGVLLSQKTYSDATTSLRISLSDLPYGVYLLKVNEQIMRLIVN